MRMGKKKTTKELQEDIVAKDYPENEDGTKSKKKNMVDEVSERVEKMDLKDDQHSNSEEDVPVVKKGGGFALLMSDGDDGDDEAVVAPQPKSRKKEASRALKLEKDAVITPEDQEDSVANEVIEEVNVKKGKKGKKGKRKADDEEDIDKLLAELESEYKGEKVSEGPVKDDKIKSKSCTKDEEKEVSANNDFDDDKIEDIKDQEDSVVNVEESQKSKKKKKKEAQKAKQEQAKIDPASKMPETAKISDEMMKPKPSGEPGTEEKKDEAGDDNLDEDESSSKRKKKKKKDKQEDDEAKGKKGKPNKKMIAAMKEMLAMQKEEEERLKREEEERIRKEEERLRAIEEAKRLEEERKERKKQKLKERKEKLKAEGKLLTTKQKMEQRRALAMLQHLKEQGIEIPEVGEKRTRPVYRPRQKKKKEESEDAVSLKDEDHAVEEEEDEPPETESHMEADELSKDDEEEEAGGAEASEEESHLKDAWDESSDNDDEDEEEERGEEGTVKNLVNGKTKDAVSEEEVEDDEEEEGEEESDNDSSSTESVEVEHISEAVKRRTRALARIEKRKEDNEMQRTLDKLRAPVVCVLGHVDHGKTKILDKLRRTNVQEGEVGGITQQIGATNVPFDALRIQTRMVKDFNVEALNFPGLLIIDTPGHESFRNLRTRGSSICDIAVLVVDITQGLEPQTIESINLLRNRKTPFLIALNKIDRMFEWESSPNKDIREVIEMQKETSRNDFEHRKRQILQALNMQGLNAALFWENPDERSYVSLVPTSAISGDGIGNLISLICTMCQNRLSKRLMFSEELQCTVLEVKTIVGHGTTIDVILVNGRLKEGDAIVLAGSDGPITTQIRSLLLPKPLKEIRVKGQYDEFKEVQAAQGVKIAAKDLEKAIAGLNLFVSYHEDETEILLKSVDQELKSAMRAIKVQDRGVYVQASTLGALEALLEFFKANSVPYSGIRVGPVAKRDVMKASAMLEHDPMYAVILAFDVKVEKDAQELADKEGVQIFSEETIYHLGDRYVEYIKSYKKRKQEEFRHIAVFPSRLKIIPTAIFNKRDPIVLGVSVEAGVLRTGTPLCVPSKEWVDLGIVTSLEFDHKPVEIAKKGVDVCIKIEPLPGQTPKLFGRHFEAADLLVSRISRDSINACKEHFRDELSKTDWKLMAELKKEFQIL